MAFCSITYLIPEDRVNAEIHQVLHKDDQRDQMSSASFRTEGAPLGPPTETREVSTPSLEKMGNKNVREYYPSEASFLTILLGSRGGRKVGAVNYRSTNPIRRR